MVRARCITREPVFVALLRTRLIDRYVLTNYREPEKGLTRRAVHASSAECQGLRALSKDGP